MHPEGSADQSYFCYSREVFTCCGFCTPEHYRCWQFGFGVVDLKFLGRWNFFSKWSNKKMSYELKTIVSITIASLKLYVEMMQLGEI